MRFKQNIVGYSTIAAYCLVIAVTFYLVQSADNAWGPYAAAFWTFVLTTILSLALTWRHLSHSLSMVKTYKKETFAINLVTAGTWILGFVALAKIPTWLYAIIAFGLKPVMTYGLHALLNRHASRAPSGPQEKSMIALVTLLVVVVCWLESKWYVGSLSQMVGGYLAAVGACFFGALYLVVSKQYETRTKLSPLQILSIRFYLTLLVCGVVAFGYERGVSFYSLSSIADLVILALFTGFVPLYLLQTSLSKIGALKVAYFTPSILLLTYLIGGVLKPHFWHWPVFGFLVAITLGLVGLLKRRF